MNHKNIMVLVIAVSIFSLSLCAGEAGRDLNKSKEKCETSSVKNYYIKLKYNSFSPISGIWELKVKNGKIESCVFNGESADDSPGTAEFFTMENLCKIARGSTLSDGEGPFIIRVTYDKNGFIESLSKIKNPEYTKIVQKDTTYKIEVINFIKEEN